MSYSIEDMFDGYLADAKDLDDFMGKIACAVDSGGRARNRVYQLAMDILVALDGGVLKGVHEMLTDVYGAGYDTAAIIAKDDTGAIIVQGQLPREVKLSIEGESYYE